MSKFEMVESGELEDMVSRSSELVTEERSVAQTEGSGCHDAKMKIVHIEKGIILDRLYRGQDDVFQVYISSDSCRNFS